MRIKGAADLYAFFLQNVQGMTIERIAQMSDEQKMLYCRKLEEIKPNRGPAGEGPGGPLGTSRRGGTVSVKQAVVNRWVGVHGMTVAEAEAKWAASMGKSDGEQ